MTITIFLIMLAIGATITSLVTEGVKRTLESLKVRYASNVVALAVSIVVGPVAAVVYYIFNDVEWTTVSIICIFLMAIGNWLTAMIGYDKVKQAILQITSKEV